MGDAGLLELRALGEVAGAQEVELHAQAGVRDFYARAGYLPEGAEFEEAGIPHVVMRRAVP